MKYLVFGIVLPVLAPSIQAQDGQRSWEYIPEVPFEATEPNTIQGYDTDGRYVVIWRRVHLTGSPRPMEFEVYDRATQGHVHHVTMPWPVDGRYIKRLFSWGGRTFLIVLDNDREVGKVTILAQPLTLPECVAEGEPIVLGALPLVEFSFLSDGAHGLRFVRSPEDERLLMFFDRVSDNHWRQLMALWVFDGGLNLVQRASFELMASSAVGHGTDGALVDDDGVVHLLVYAKFDAADGEKGEPGYKLFRVEQGEVRSLPVAGTEGMEVTSASCIRVDNELVIGGFFEQDGKFGRFHATRSVDLGSDGRFDVFPLNEATKKYRRAVMVANPEGGYYLMGNACLPEGTSLYGTRELSVNACAEDGAHLWSRTIPRYVSAYGPERTGIEAYVLPQELVLLVPGGSEQVESYKAGKAPKLSVASHVLSFRFDHQGMPAYDVFGTPDHWASGDGWLLSDGHTIFQRVRSKSDEKEGPPQKGFAFIDLRH